MYGSTRDYSLLDQHSNLNTGLGEGVSYRARLLIAIRTEITDNVEICPDKNGIFTHVHLYLNNTTNTYSIFSSTVELEETFPISESSYSKNEEFFLFSTILEASMIEKKLCDRPVFFELSMGNAGNSLDGQNETQCNNLSDGEEEFGKNLSRAISSGSFYLSSIKFTEGVDVSSYSSTTSACKPISHDKAHYFLPYWDYKPCMDVRCVFPDLRRRMYNSTMISKLTEKMEEGLTETNTFLEEEDPRAEVRLRACLEEVATSCAKYLTITKSNILGLGSGKTKLDKERMKLCQREIESIGNMSRNLRALVTRSSMKERYKTAQSYLQKLRFLIDDPQHGLPDIFIWLIANGKRIAYHRMSARDAMFSTIDEECGIHCAEVQNVFLKLPGKHATGPAGWLVQAKLTIYLWLGTAKDKKYFYSGLPMGYDMSHELKNAERPRALAPSTIHYVEKHVSCVGMELITIRLF